MPDPTVTLILASIDDINTHLPTDKLDASDSSALAAISLFSIDVDRLVKGTLSGVFTPTILASWATPTDTPEWIRRAAGMLIAAMWYSNRFSEDNAGVVPGFAQEQYNCGMSMLMQVQQGQVIIPISEAPTAGTLFSEAFFQPNSQTTPPKFSMDTVFG